MELLVKQHGGAREGSGKPKGYKASRTLIAQTQKAKFIELVEAEIVSIANALIEKAKAGDVSAAKELFDRAWGKAIMPIAIREVPVFSLRELAKRRDSLKVTVSKD